MAVKYDVNTDYMELINQARAKGNESAAKVYEEKRNAKINGTGITVSDPTVIRENEDRARYANSDAGKADAIKRATQNEHMDYINKTNPGGFDAYYATQQQKYNDAIANGDQDMLNRLEADAQRVGYTIIPGTGGVNGKGTTTATPQVGVPQAGAVSGGQSNSMQSLMDLIKQMGDSSFEAQKAQLDATLNNQLTELKKAYDQAVADGELSVREAETQFNEQKKQIEQQAYLDAERTGLYTQEMGIQNSQQAVGIMQGDQARKNGLINQNTTERDKRIADIQTRLNSIKTQKNLDMVKAKNDYDYGILGAKAQSNQQVNQNMFGLLQDDYKANRDQGFARENMSLADQIQRGQMELQQGYTQKNIQTQFQNSLLSATHDSNLAIERMNVQQGFDLQKMSVALEQDMQKMAKQFGYSSALNSQEQANRIASIKAEYSAKAQAEKDNYDRDLERNLRGVTPGTKEYDLITKTYERDFKNKMTELHNSTVYEAVVTDIINSKPTTTPNQPKDYRDGALLGNLDPGANLMNWITGYSKDSANYNSALEAIKRYNDMMGSATTYMPWTK